MYDPLLYSLVHTGNPGDIAFYLRRCFGAMHVLELGVGYGRVMTELLRAGMRVTGVDLHPGLLALAQEKVAALPAKVRERATLLTADMTTLTLRERFDRVIIPHSGLWCLRDDAEVRACLASVRGLLAPGGRLLFDAYAADAFHAECAPEDQSDDQLDEVATLYLDGRELRVYEQSRWDRARQTIVATYVYIDQRARREVRHDIVQRYLLLPQLEALLHEAGFRVERVSGDFEGAVYTEDSDVLAVEASLRG